MKSYKEFKRPYAILPDKQKAQVDQVVVADAKTNRYDETTKTLTLTLEQDAAFPFLVSLYEDMFLSGGGDQSLPKNYIKSAEEIRQLTCFFAWTAWAAGVERPGKDYSYTNNWPPEEAVGNRPTKAVFLWSVLSLISLLGGIALVLMFFGRFDYMGWGGGEPPNKKSLSLKDFKITPSQLATYKYFLVVMVLFAFQTLMGVFTAHYFVEATGFYGIDTRRTSSDYHHPHLASAAFHLLDIHRLAGRGAFHRALHQQARTQTPGFLGKPFVRGGGPGGGGFHCRRVPGSQG